MESFKKLFKRADVILILCLLIICALLFLPKFFNKSDNMTAEIYKNGKLFKSIDLGEVKEIYEFDLNSNPNSVIEVSKNKIRYKHSQCPDKLCEKTGWLTKVGDSAACLPAKTMIVIKGDSKEDAPDAISY